jgi:rare lipoprotein A
MRRKRTVSALAVLGVALALEPTGSGLAAAPPRPGSHSGAKGRIHETYASWYGSAFARRRTASGELYNPDALTAAHPTLPLGSRVRVTHLGNGRSVILRITDRGPYMKGRGIDLSRAAASRLRMVAQGVARVRVEQLAKSAGPGPVVTAIAGLPSALDGAHAVSL